MRSDFDKNDFIAAILGLKMAENARKLLKNEILTELQLRIQNLKLSTVR